MPTAARASIRVLVEPQVYLVGRQVLNTEAMEEFLDDHGMAWDTDTDVAGERLAEAAGRLCYLSFGKGRKTNKEYLQHILTVGHGSVLEHAVWNFIFAGVSRSMTHELVRHRAGFGYSQLSQRYVDESQADFVAPPIIAEDPELRALFEECVRHCQETYVTLAAKLTERYAQVPDLTLRRKLARQAARAVLPNATETRIFVTANARALRHFIELRGDEHADVEIRAVAVKLWEIMREEAPNLFGDYERYDAPDGTPALRTQWRKV
ncbi:MAG: FAD-dependent thymidylate synthase [Planctomycetota bacterium]|nr:MAG: FAD-dependent thymidylate synthase [Planctomycetota bacterium]